MPQHGRISTPLSEVKEAGHIMSEETHMVGFLWYKSPD